MPAMQETQETWAQSLVGKIPWRRKWQPTPGFLPGESHGQRSLAGYSAWVHKEPDTTEHTLDWTSIGVTLNVTLIHTKLVNSVYSPLRTAKPYQKSEHIFPLLI